jgi:hypothetical protein
VQSASAWQSLSFWLASANSKGIANRLKCLALL